jgi:Fur family ferric uptake transcriptional regulator
MKKKRPSDDSLQDVRRRLVTAGLRRTAARIAVLRHLRGTGKPQTHAEVAAALAEQGFDKATVYRNLVDLTQVGLLSMFEPGDAARYEWHDSSPDDTSGHAHFVCLDCGDIACLDDVTVRITPAPGSRSSAMRDVTQVLLKGHCGRCG